MRVVAALHGVDLISSYQFEEEIGAASSENGLFIAKRKFSVRKALGATRDLCVSRCALASQNRPIDQVEELLMLQPALPLSKPGLDSTLLPPEMPRNASSR
jgi:hypothetical protein